MYAADKFKDELGVPVVVLATAHPAKFPDSIIEAGLEPPEQPKQLVAMLGQKERMDELPASVEELKAHILDAIN